VTGYWLKASELMFHGKHYAQAIYLRRGASRCSMTDRAGQEPALQGAARAEARVLDSDGLTEN
jgi:hypothetical protein